MGKKYENMCFVNAKSVASAMQGTTGADANELRQMEKYRSGRKAKRNKNGTEWKITFLFFSHIAGWVDDKNRPGDGRILYIVPAIHGQRPIA